MERKSVVSSNVVSVGCDTNTRILEVEFKSGIYHYKGVPLDKYAALMTASSVGKYLNDHIKPFYACEKL